MLFFTIVLLSAPLISNEHLDIVKDYIGEFLSLSSIQKRKKLSSIIISNKQENAQEAAV